MVWIVSLPWFDITLATLAYFLSFEHAKLDPASGLYHVLPSA